MQIVQDRTADIDIVALEGRIDSSNAGEVEGALVPLFGDSGGGVLVDLEKLDYISSAGLRILLIAAKRSKATGTRLALAGMQPGVREVFEISGFAKLFDIYDARASALTALS